MYDVPDDIDTLLENCRGEINQICFGPHDIQIHCSNYSFLIQTQFVYTHRSETVTGNTNNIDNNSIFLKAVGADIIDIERINASTICLHLSEKRKITLISEPEFESIIITLPNQIEPIII